MAFNVHRFNTHSHYHHVHPISKLTVEPIVTCDALRRELEKEIIREEILAGEIERRRREILELEVRREMILERREVTSLPRIGGVGFTSSALWLGLGQAVSTRCYEYESEMLPYGGFERRDVSGGCRGEVGGVEAVRLQRRVWSLENDDKKEMIGLGLPSCSKRKAPSPRLPSNKEDFRCADCNIKAPSAKGLEQHLKGRKHLAMRKKIKKRPKPKKGKKH
ncbi:uncharacterized protein LOC143613886 [Bidens hawaiensis]|uniref:uncharacterized protein LOC143613886 n=1 Tax=Bidens hawaiensis TaxID=980011 RepID=UPI00404B53A0